MTELLRTRVLRELTVASPSSPTRARKLSAASGLVFAGDFFHVIADDENHLGVFPAEGEAEGSLLRLFPGELPDGRKARKASKADPEALSRLPAFDGFPFGALLAWGSGSRATRCQGALLALEVSGGVAGASQLVDLTVLYDALSTRFPELNVEGAVVSGEQLILLQRGSRKQPENACVRLQLGPVLSALGRGAPLAAQATMATNTVELGDMAGVGLSFTDGAALADGRIVFTAVAENAKDSYEDGPCAGAVVGILSNEGRLLAMQPLDIPHKVEGLDARLIGDCIQLRMVTDADDASVPGLLIAAEMAAYS